MEIFNQTAKERIALAYDLFKKEEFLDRVFKFLIDSEVLIRHDERRDYMADRITSAIIEGVKSKPGPKAKNNSEIGEPEKEIA